MSSHAASSWASSGDGHRTLAERALAALHEGIVSGELAAGQRLRIEELAAALNMSHLPIREAIRQLESRGLVEHIPHRGARVTELSVADAVQIYDARLLIEPEILRRAAERFTDDDVAAARTALARHNEVSAGDRRVETWQTHTEFHFALYDPCGSPWLLRVVKPLWETSQRYRLTIPAVNAEQRRVESAVEHEEMLLACSARDGERAAKALYDHLVRSANLITTHMDGTATFRAWSEL
ncbi:MAG TPA: GntR family transcriptional regulator [Polyangiaceae bacterium]|jgi:DNA-binding GntR family transcriptional regulator|nr:GntR family transcriptional regulator [Polyangiaceae bacterium]